MKKICVLMVAVFMFTVLQFSGCGTVDEDTKSPHSLAEVEELPAQDDAAGTENTDVVQDAEDAGAENTEVTQNTDATAGEDQQETVEVAGTAITEAPESMNLYRTLPFFYEDEEWQLAYYVTAEVSENGELMLDDSCGFYLKAVSGTQEYLLFDEQVQLGIPEAEVFIDIDGMLHIVVKDVRTAEYKVTDYVFDSEVETFLGTVELKYEGINFMGGTE